MKDKDLSLACYKVYNDWMADFQAYAPERFVCNATLPTTGIDDCIDELHRCADMGLRTAQLEAYPSGNFSEPVARGRPVLGGGGRARHADQRAPAVLLPGGRPRVRIVNAEGSPDRDRRAKALGIDIAAGRVPGDPLQDDHHGGLRAVPGPQVRRDREPRRLGSVLPGAFRRVGPPEPADWNLPLLPSEYFHRNVLVVYIIDEARPAGALRHRRGQHHVGPDFPHSTSSWPVDYQLGRSSSSEPVPPLEIERIMWRTAADLYKIPYDDPASIKVAA